MNTEDGREDSFQHSLFVQSYLDPYIKFGDAYARDDLE